MNNPQDRIIKKMIDNIVERNRPEFEKQAETTAGTTTSTASPVSEDNQIVSRKIEYGFNSMRQENAEIRKSLDEVKGTLNMMRSDLDSIRMAVQQATRGSSAPERQVSQASPAHSMGAPQYRKTEADEAYEKGQDGDSGEASKPQQARGFQKKDPATDIDISKVFYYGKK